MCFLLLLKSFWAVYKTGGINKAAKFLDMAPPTLSQNIKQLERQLGKKLFTAQKWGSDPTGDATALFPLVEGAFDYLTQFNEQLENPSKGVIRIGLTTAFASFFFVKFAAAFKAKYPTLHLEYHHHPNHDYMQMLENGDIDIGIMLGMREPSAQNTKFKLSHNEITFFATKEFAKKHNLSSEISANQLINLPLISFSAKTRLFLDDIETWIGAPFTNPIEVHTSHAAYDMTMNGMGIGFHYIEYLLAQKNDQIAFLKVNDRPALPARIYECAHGKKPSALVALFIKELKEFYSI